ncbi:MAG TPA: DUF2849 domain-containing protein [Alphaproteobacteria bacterium]|nr:DUF2849 domain-containing protein [Alphaproteobacteria bacterium]HAJ45262.1 DUF2849 domain-containing protein [Alphaproteobacteria bacterium]
MQVLTANRLADGAVVYLTAVGGWSEHLAEASVLASKDAATSAEAQGQAAIEARLVVGVYLMDVLGDGAAPRPRSMREIIRAAGPSVRLDLGKQAGHS